jgi:hypothetical protein
MLQIRSAKERYAEISTHHCPRCGSFAGMECVDGVTGKKRRVPHRDRIEAANVAPRRPRKAEPVARAASTPARAPRAPKGSQAAPAAQPDGSVHGLMSALARAFTAG